MDDDHSKEEKLQPSTSKKEKEKLECRDDMDDKRDDPDGHDSRKYSESSETSFVSGNSRLDMARPRNREVKQPTVKKQTKLSERNKKGGRVEKRRMTRRSPKKVMRRRKPKEFGKKRDLSVSTIFTRLSATSAVQSIGCKYCGHRCCRRRYEQMKAFSKAGKVRRKRKPRTSQCKKKGSECIQFGSRSLMLSPLCVNTNTTPSEEVKEESIHYSEVTPEMIYECLRRLTMWKQEVATVAILDFIKRNYPVCQDIPALFEELLEKLQVASIAGIVTQTAANCWGLSCALQSRHLTKNHVTLFWNIYADTMRPVTKNLQFPLRE